jgi:hypothetical protein
VVDKDEKVAVQGRVHGPKCAAPQKVEKDPDECAQPSGCMLLASALLAITTDMGGRRSPSLNNS